MGRALVEAKRIRGFSRSFRLHFHEEYSIALVYEGRSRAAASSETAVVSAGSLVMIPNGVPHACNPDIRGAWSYSLLLADPAWVRNLSDDPRTQELLFSGKLQTLPASPGAAEAFEEAAFSLSLGDEAARGDAEDNLKALILSSLDRPGVYARTLGPEPRPRGCRSDRRAARVEAFLRERYDRRVTLREIAEVAGVCERAALRIFRSEYGFPPYTYLTNLRVNEAKRLLRSGMSPADTAAAAGFYDQSHLARLFVRHVGLPPAAYAATFRNHVRIVQDERNLTR